jgi:hypothetical protein
LVNRAPVPLLSVDDAGAADCGGGDAAPAAAAASEGPLVLLPMPLLLLLLLPEVGEVVAVGEEEGWQTERSAGARFTNGTKLLITNPDCFFPARLSGIFPVRFCGRIGVRFRVRYATKGVPQVFFLFVFVEMCIQAIVISVRLGIGSVFGFIANRA